MKPCGLAFPVLRNIGVRRSNAQHWELIEALRAGDPLLARLCVQTHIITARPKAMAPRPLVSLELL